MWNDCSSLGVIIISVFLAKSSGNDLNMDSSLQLLHIVHRHGDRTPISIYPKDPYQENTWPQGLGQLTNAGKQRMYAIGSILRETYGSFTTSSPRSVSSRSSAKDRCLMSAEALLASFYDPEGMWIWDHDLEWQPIPIQTVPLAQDGMLNPDSPCPKASWEENQILNSPEGQAVLQRNKKLFELLTNYTGWDVHNWTIVEYIYDNLSIEKANNLTIPAWSYDLWNNLTEVADAAFYLDSSTRLMQRLRAGLLIKDIVKNIKDKISGVLPSNKKLFLYSTHDTLLAPLLSGLGVFNRLAPPYGAAVIFELHKLDPENYTLQLLYKNETYREPFVLKMPSCQQYCPVDDFFKAVEDLIPNDWKKECSSAGSASSMTILASVMGGVAFVLLVIILLLIGTQWKQRHRYQRISTVPM